MQQVYQKPLSECPGKAGRVPKGAVDMKEELFGCPGRAARVPEGTSGVPGAVRVLVRARNVKELFWNHKDPFGYQKECSGCQDELFVSKEELRMKARSCSGTRRCSGTWRSCRVRGNCSNSMQKLFGCSGAVHGSRRRRRGCSDALETFSSTRRSCSGTRRSHYVSQGELHA